MFGRLLLRVVVIFVTDVGLPTRAVVGST